jgi:hypothetical protein
VACATGRRAWHFVPGKRKTTGAKAQAKICFARRPREVITRLWQIEAETLLVGAVGTVGRLGHQLGLTNHERFVTANPDRAGGLGL